MINHRFSPIRVLIDIDTQKDMLTAAGACNVCNHKRLLANIRRIMAAARHNHIPTISTAQVYNPMHRNPGFCLAGTDGPKKVSYTLRGRCLRYPASDSTDLPLNLLGRYDQVIFYKRGEDPFEEPRLDRMLTELRADELYLIGATAEGAVKATAIGLLARGKKVTVLTDAVGTRNYNDAAKALRKMKAKGARLSKVRKVFGGSMLKGVHACSCDNCRAVSQIN